MAILACWVGLLSPPDIFSTSLSVSDTREDLLGGGCGSSADLQLSDLRNLATLDSLSAAASGASPAAAAVGRSRLWLRLIMACFSFCLIPGKGSMDVEAALPLPWTTTTPLLPPDPPLAVLAAFLLATGAEAGDLR